MRSSPPLASAGAFVLVAYWAALVAGVDSPLVTHWTYLTLLTAPSVAVVVRAVRRREQRFAWGVLGLGLSLWTLGSVWQVLGELHGIVIVSPGPADALWLVIYPCTLLTFAALARPWLRHSGITLALDTASIVLVAAAVVTAAVLPPLMANQGQLSGGAQIVTLAYPVGDSVLLSAALIGAAVAGWRAGAVWRLLAVGIVMLVAGDILWTLQAAAGTWQPVMGSNAVYPVFPGLAAIAAWQPRSTRPFVAGNASVRTHAAVLIAVVAAIALLTANEWSHVPGTSIVLAALGLLAAVHRTAIALDEAGVALSIDDFGTGHSSLARIARFPISEVKIDRSFVSAMHDAKLPIVSTTIELAHALGLRVVAEGIEDQATLEALRALGCDIAQGYHLSRPLCSEDFSAWLELSNRTLIGVTNLSEERDPCWKSQGSQSDSAASPRCTTPPSRSATGASAA